MVRSATANQPPSGRFADATLAGEGAEGGVWFARDRQRGGRRVVLKWIPPDRLAATRRVFRLVEAAASPHLAPLLELLPASPSPTGPSPTGPAPTGPLGSPHAPNEVRRELAGGGAWLVMGWVDGEPLARGPSPWSTVAPWLDGLARALEVLHGLGAHHGDVSPANVVLTPTGAAVLVDFGAVAAHGVGTPGFMAPEVLHGGGGPAADTWSLGAIACWCWLGDVPARDLTRLGDRRDVDRRLRVLHGAAEQPSRPPERAALRLLAAMLDPDPGARPTMAGVVDALHTWASGVARDAVAGEHVVWTRPPDGATGWPWIGDELERIVDAARRRVPLVEIVGDEDAGVTWLTEAAAAALTTLGADVEILDVLPIDALVERWLEAPEGRVLLARTTARGTTHLDPSAPTDAPRSSGAQAAATSEASSPRSTRPRRPSRAPRASHDATVGVHVGTPARDGGRTIRDALRRSTGIARATLVLAGLDEDEPRTSGGRTASTETTATTATTETTETTAPPSTTPLHTLGDGPHEHGVCTVLLRAREDRQLQQLLAVAGIRRRVRPWVDALRASSGGLAGRARHVVATWIERHAQAPHVHDVARALAERRATALSPLDATRVLEVAWGVDTVALEPRLGEGQIPHDVVLAAARHELARLLTPASLHRRARAAYDVVRARGEVVTPSLAMDLWTRASARAHGTPAEPYTPADDQASGDDAQAVVDVLLACDEDGVFHPHVSASVAEGAAFDACAMACLAERVARLQGVAAPEVSHVIATATAYVALARRRSSAGAPDDALACCLAAHATSSALGEAALDPSLHVALTLEHARALQRLGRAREARTILHGAAAWVVEGAAWRTAAGEAGADTSPAIPLLRVAALEARIAVDVGDAATLLEQPSPLRAAASDVVAQGEAPWRQAPAGRRLAWRRVILEYTTWSTLLALHGGDLPAAKRGAEALLAYVEAPDVESALGLGRIARALQVAGNVAQVEGRLRDAAGLYARAAAAFRARGEDDVAALVLASAAGLAWPTGDVARALELGRAALRRALARMTATPAAARLGVWGMLANLAPALLATDPAELAAWIDALDDDRTSTGLEAARRAVFRAQRDRTRASDGARRGGRVASQEALLAADAPRVEAEARLVEAEARLVEAETRLVEAETRLVEAGARDEAIAFALDDVGFALRRDEHPAAGVHLRRAIAWATDAPQRDDVAALLAATRADHLAASWMLPAPALAHDTPDAHGEVADGHALDVTTVSAMHERRAVITTLAAVGAPETWAAREQHWVALRLRLACHRLLRLAARRDPPPEHRRRASEALRASESQLTAELEVVMRKTPPTDRPNVLRSLALADDEVEWLEGLAAGGAHASPPARQTTHASVAHAAAEGSDAEQHRALDPEAPRHGGPVRGEPGGGHGGETTHPGGDAPRGEGIARPRDDASWRARALAAYRRLAREDELERVLAQFVDALMELTDAERGLVVLSDEGARIEVARELHGEGDAVHVSRSVVERVIESGEPVLATDAVEDARFGRARSVSHLALRSILAVPLRHRGRVIGAAYVDHRLRRGAFDEASLAGVEAFADLASLAIAHARALSLLRARSEALAAREAELAAALEAREVEVTALRHEAGQGASLEIGTRTLVGASSVMQRVFRLLRRVATSNVPVVIAGESGTGKELVARALHELGPRAKAPFIAENCAAIPESLLESALFGHARGAFTGAVQAAPGLFEAASGGTLFLDEITETSLAMQSKLLRVLQEGEVRRLGETSSRRVDVRVVVATNRDLEQLVAEGKFRQDLYYRLSVVRVDVPALRERVEDIPQLIAHFLRITAQGDELALRVSSGAMRRLVRHTWPGNVRELENEVRRWLALVDDVVREEDLSPAILAATGGLVERRELPPGEALVELLADPAFAFVDEDEPGVATASDPSPPKLDDAALDLRTHVERVERALVGEALRRTGNNLTRAARLLGLSRFGLQKKLRRRDDGHEPTLGGERAGTTPTRAGRTRALDLPDGEPTEEP